MNARRVRVTKSAVALKFESLKKYASEMQKDSTYCRKCPLYRYPLVPSDFGNEYPHSRIMIVGEAPAETEREQGQVFVGAAGQVLMEGIAAFGHRRNETYITNAVKCYLPAKEKAMLVSKKRNPDDPDWLETLDGVADLCCRLHLYKEVELGRPKLVIALGETALRPVTGYRGISKTRGKVLPSTHEMMEGRMVFATYHPAFILRKGGLRGTLSQDLKTAFESVFGSTKTPVTYKFLTNEADVMRFFDSLEKETVIACDFETSGFNYEKDKVECSAYDFRNGKILCASFSTKSNTATVIPFYGFKAKPMWEDGPWKRIKRRMKILFEDQRKKWVFHNWAFDVRFAHVTFGIDPRKMNFDDTFLMQFTIDENMPKSLKDLVHMYTDMGDYESEVLAADIVGKYTREVRSKGTRRIQKGGEKK